MKVTCHYIREVWIVSHNGKDYRVTREFVKENNGESDDDIMEVGTGNIVDIDSDFGMELLEAVKKEKV